MSKKKKKKKASKIGMDFKDNILQLAERIKKQKDAIQTEEARISEENARRAAEYKAKYGNRDYRNWKEFPVLPPRKQKSIC